MHNLSRFLASGSLLTKVSLIATAIFLCPPAHAQTPARNFGNVTLCPANQAGSSSCMAIQPFAFSVPSGPAYVQVLTEGAANLDFSPVSTQCVSVGGPVTCAGAVKFVPRYAGLRRGAIQIVNNSSGQVMLNIPIFGVGIGPQIGFGLNGFAPFGRTSGPEYALGVDGEENVYVAGDDVTRIAANGSASKIASGVVTTGLAIDGAGNVLLGDLITEQVFAFSPSGLKSTIASHEMLRDLAVDGAGDIFMASESAGQLLRLAPNGTTSVIASQTNYNGVAVDATGNVLTDDGTGQLLKISPGGAQTIMADGFASGTGGIAVDAAGNVFALDTSKNVKKISPDGTMETVASSAIALALDDSGNLFVLETNGSIMKTTRSTAPTFVFTSGNDTPQTANIENTGNSPLRIAGLSLPDGFQLTPGNGLLQQCTIGLALQPAQSCNINVALESGSATTDPGKLALTYTGAGGSFTTSISLRPPVSLSLTGDWSVVNGINIVEWDKFYTATLTFPSNLAPVPSGTVTFSAKGDVTPGCSDLYVSGRTIQCHFRAPSTGTVTLSAQYSGDQHYAPSTVQSPTLLVNHPVCHNHQCTE